MSKRLKKNHSHKWGLSLLLRACFRSPSAGEKFSYPYPQGTNPAPPLHPLPEVRVDPMSEVAKPPQVKKNSPPPLFPMGTTPFSPMLPSIKTKNSGTFNNEPKGLTGEILPGKFENVNYNKYCSIRTDKTKGVDMCIFDIYNNVVGCSR